MRILQLFFLLVIWNAPQPPAPRWLQTDMVTGLSIFASGYMAVVLGLKVWGRKIILGRFSGDLWRGFVRFNRGVDVARFFVPGWFAVGVFYLGWRPLVGEMLRPIEGFSLLSPATAIGLVPGLLGWMGLWWSQYAVDRATREQNLLAQIEADLPVFAPPTFGQYFSNKFRTQVLFTLVPVMGILLLRDAVTVAVLETSRTRLGQFWGLQAKLSDKVDPVVSTAAVLLVLVISPLIVRRVLDTRPLPASRLRESLTAVCRQSNLRCREILLWHTHYNIGNAAVMGLVPRVRFVMLSDLLLAGMTDEQIQAVFAHELGHVRHRHLVWLVLFFLLVGSGVFDASAVLERHLRLAEAGEIFYDWTSALLCGLLLLAAFGLMSRWFERQADVYAARTMSRVHARDGAFGSDLFASALARVAVVNNIPVTAPNLTHGSIQSRVDYIRKFGTDATVGRRFDRTGTLVRILLLGLLLASGLFLFYSESTQ